MTSTLDKLHAILRRDLLTAVRHRSGFVVTLVGVLHRTRGLLFSLPRHRSRLSTRWRRVLSFSMVGTGLYTFFVMSAQAFLSAVQEAQQTGTLEVLMTTSTAAGRTSHSQLHFRFCRKLGQSTRLSFRGSGRFSAPRSTPTFSRASRVLIFSLAIALALGIAAATLQVAFQKGSAFAVAARFRTLVSERNHVPDSELAAPARTPRARCSSDLRHRRNAPRAAGRAVLDHAMAPTLAVLAGFSVVLLPLALAGLSFSLRRARQNGTLSFY